MNNLPDLSADLVRKLNTPGPRYTSYPTAPEWSANFGARDHARALELAGTDAKSPLSLYVHLPFCQDMCTYCGCNVIVTKNQNKVAAYLESLATELGRVAGHLGRRRTLSRLHYGGGTPTFLDQEKLARLWALITEHFSVRPDAEVAVEIDPTVTSVGQLALLRKQGFGRLSMGVQDFDASVQAAVGRMQPFELTRDLVAQARALGFESINLDLIYGLPLQTPSGFAATIERVLAIRPERVALFSFAYLPKVKPHQRRLPTNSLPSPMEKLGLFRIAHDQLCGAGYRWIGMDHFALESDELARAQNNRTLWRDFQGYTVLRASDTVAFGVSGISSIGKAYAQNVKSLTEHAATLRDGRLPTERGVWLSEDDVTRRNIITQLMCNFWVDLGADGSTKFSNELERLHDLERDGLVSIKGNEVTVTALGRVFVRNVAMVFDTYLARRMESEQPTFSQTV